MSEAPERIWASVAGTNSEGRFGIWDLRRDRRDNPDWTEYVPADRIAAVEAERDVLREAVREAEVVVQAARYTLLGTGIDSYACGIDAWLAKHGGSDD